MYRSIQSRLLIAGILISLSSIASAGPISLDSMSIYLTTGAVAETYTNTSLTNSYTANVGVSGGSQNNTILNLTEGADTQSFSMLMQHSVTNQAFSYAQNGQGFVNFTANADATFSLSSSYGTANGVDYLGDKAPAISSQVALYEVLPGGGIVTLFSDTRTDVNGQITLSNNTSGLLTAGSSYQLYFLFNVQQRNFDTAGESASGNLLLNIASTSSVPAPPALPLLCLGLAGLIFNRSRQSITRK